jgi:hypothetical protein
MPQGNSRWVLGPNEPDLWTGDTIAPVVNEWNSMEMRLSDWLFVSPAPSHLHPDWLTQFRDAFYQRYGRWPMLDAIAIHCYQSADQCIELIERYKRLAQDWGVPEGWVTEFAYTSEAWGPAWQGEIKKLVAYMDSDPWISRYSPYVSRQNCSDGTWDCARAGDPSLFEPDGRLTEIGRVYADR